MPHTLVIVNPHAGSGRALHVVKEYRQRLQAALGPHDLVVTQSVDEVPQLIAQAADQGTDRVLSVGGDGTSYAVLNALMHVRSQQPDCDIGLSILPAGTGRDFARGLGMPLDLGRAIDELIRSQPQAVDIGRLQIDHQTHYFLNISSAGISQAVVHHVEQAPRRRPWTYWLAVMRGILCEPTVAMDIWLDGQRWFDGRAYVVAIANGSSFGSGMQIAPTAQVDDGLFDVVLIEDMPRLRLLMLLRTVFDGSHVKHPEVHVGRAREISLMPHSDLIGIDIDGEAAAGHRLTYTLLPGALRMLL